METTTLWNPFWWIGIGGIITFIFCCITGSIIIVSTSLIYSWQRQKKFFEIYAKQVLRMALFFILIYLSLLGVGIIYVSRISSHPLISFTLKGLSAIIKKNYSLIIPFEGVFFSFFLCAFLYFFWDLFKNVKLLRVIFSIFTMLAIWVSIYLIINSKVILFSRGLYALEQIAFSKLLIPPSEISIILLLTYLILGIGSAGGSSAFMLLLRRKKEDYGRDYYKFAIPLSSKWNLGLLLLIPLLVLTGIIVYNGKLPEINSLLYTMFLLFIFLIGCTWINIKIIKSPQPLRLKEMIFLCPTIALIIDGTVLYILILVTKEVILRT